MTGYERRHSRWYERMLLGMPFQLLVGSVLVALIPGIWAWGGAFWQSMDPVRVNTLAAVVLAFMAALVTLRRLAHLSGGDVIAYIAPLVTGGFLLAVAVLFFTRSPYSRPLVLSSYFVALAWCYAGYFVGKRYRKLKFALVPLGNVRDVQSAPNVEIRSLPHPDLAGVRYDGVVADLRTQELTPEWERFLAECILARIPVFHTRQVYEAMTGRIQIEHLSENELGSLLPSPLYSMVKRLIDVIAVVATLPLTLPLMVVVAIAIRLDSPGPALFVQSRVGQGNQDFTIYKFRSMHVDAEKNGACLAAEDDDRITRVGRFIRLTRLDELPQLLNVLKGEMSLIGPRPEQRVFVDQFNVEIPFYIYRHVVRPGITGWAQVMQGYTDDADSTRVKVQHDFYYIKHFSLWLDILIVFKTVKILITGQGAR